MNLDKLTDFEINKAVDDALKIPSQSDYSDGMVCATYTDYTGYYDKCMELMINSGISLIKLDGTNVWIACAESRFYTPCVGLEGSDAEVTIFYNAHVIHHTKPLRAVCECFLTVHESKP